MTDLPDVKLKAVVSFPATIVDGTGIDVSKTNGKYRLDIAFDDFAPPVGGITDAAHQNALLWNDLTSAYTLVPVSVIGTGGAVPEAPNDGVQYGRQSLGWTAVTPYTNEQVDDRVAALIQNGTGITWTYNDAAGTLTPTVTAGGSTAATTTFVPAGNVAATNVQAAIAEVDAEKAPLATISTSPPSGGVDGDVWYQVP